MPKKSFFTEMIWNLGKCLYLCNAELQKRISLIYAYLSSKCGVLR